MDKKQIILNRLEKAKENNSGIITFHFEDGSKQRQPINKELFVDEKGKDLSFEKVAIKINEIAHNLKAKYYIIT